MQPGRNRRIPTRTMGLAALVLVMTVAGCGRFSRTPPDTLEPQGGFPEAESDPRPLIAQVTALQIESAPGGIIIRALGEPPTLGYWDPGLVRVGGAIGEEADTDPDTLEFTFRARPPLLAEPAGSARARQIEAAVFVADAALTGVSRIAVLGAQSSRTARR